MIKKICSGNSIVLDHGSVFAIEQGSDIDIVVDLEGTVFTIKFQFNRDESGKQLLEKRVNVAEDIIEIRCTNFENTLGTGTTKAIELASQNGNAIKLHFWVFQLGEENMGARRLDYTLFMDETSESRESLVS